MFTIPTFNIGVPIRMEDTLIFFYLIINLRNILNSRVFKTIQVKSLVIFSFISFLSLFKSILEGYSSSFSDFNTIFMNIKAIMIFVIGFNLLNKENDYSKIFNYLSIGLFISSIFSIIQYFDIGGIGKLLYLVYGKEERIEYGIIRSIGSVGNPNYASYFSITLFLIIIFFYKSRYKLLSLIPLLAAILSFSRTGIISVIVILFILFIFYKTKFSTKLIIISIAAVSLFNFSSLLTEKTRLGTILDQGKAMDTSLGGRSNLIWESKLQSFYDKPFLGIGTLKNNNSDTVFDITVFDNSYLYLLITSGIIGFICYSIFYTDIIFNILRKFKKNKIYLFILLYLLNTFIFFITTDLIKNIFYLSFNMLVFGIIKKIFINDARKRNISHNSNLKLE